MTQPHEDPAPRSADDLADEERVEGRAELLPEELAAGSDDPQAQAEAILAESDERTEHPEQTRHESVQSPD
jgi:hypothetical protein